MHSQPLTKSLRERTSSVNVVQLKPRRRFLHRMGLLQVLNDYVQVAIVKLRTPARHFGQAPDKVDGLIFLRELAQTIDELRMEQSGHDDSMQACAREFGIHHETRDPPIAVDERMNFRHQKHVENSTSYSLRNAESDARTFFEGSPYLRRVHELGRTGVVRLRLNICLVGGIYGWFRSSGMVLLNDVMRRCRLIHRACLWTSRGAFHWHTRRLVHRCEALGG